jgi:phosphonate transport system substrate-binding protein
LGSRDAAEATVLPLHFLREEGCSLDDVKIISLDEEVDLRGNPCSSEHHVLQAILAKRGEMGVIGERLWSHLQKSDPTRAAHLKLVWRSPEFSHCVFTSHADLDDARAKRFTELMLAMDNQDERCAEVLRLEGAKSWVAGSGEGFEDLISALQEPGSDR